MKWHDYQISTHEDEDIEEIVLLVSSLWGNNAAYNRQIFRWKHRENPLLKGNIGLVARHLGKVIGFLGYVPAEYKAGENRFGILQQCDTVIRPEHRGKGLFSAMTRAGLQMYGGGYRYIVNFTSTRITAEGLLKLGWQPLVETRYLRRINWLNLITPGLSPESSPAINPGRYGNIEVSENIRKANIVADNRDNVISLYKTPDFLEWRLSNPKYRFRYLYHLGSHGVDAWVVIRVRKHNAHIFDYEPNRNSPGIQNLLTFIFKHPMINTVTFFNSTAPDELEIFLRKNRFRNVTRLEKIILNQPRNIPIIIRPTSEKYTNVDWYVGGIDVRDSRNWHITEICFD